MEASRMYVGGRLIEAAAGATLDVVCPATDEVVAKVAFAGADDVENVVMSAREGFKVWSRFSLAERKEWMDRVSAAVETRKDELIDAVMAEHGKTYDGALEDAQTIIDSLDYFSTEAMSLNETIIPDRQGEFEHKVVHEPIGVVAAFLAWNFPLLNLGFKLGPVLAAGCSLIVKPSKKTPYSAYVFADICHEIGFPAGVINVAAGDNGGFGTGLQEHHKVAGITLIGSTETGLKLVRNSTTSVKRFSMELGGNAPFLVFADADLEAATDLLVGLKAGNAGQICVSPNRVLVEKGVVEEFKALLVRKLSGVKLGFGRNSGATMGPVIDHDHLKEIMEKVDAAVAGGATVVFGNDDLEVPATGSFMAPTVVENVAASMDLSCNEIFGPVIPLFTFTTEEEALQEANNTTAGLASYLFTNDINRANRVSRALEFGEVMVNGAKWASFLPHIGIKQSGMGVDNSRLALYDYLYHRRISVKLG